MKGKIFAKILLIRMPISPKNTHLEKLRINIEQIFGHWAFQMIYQSDSSKSFWGDFSDCFFSQELRIQSFFSNDFSPTTVTPLFIFIYCSYLSLYGQKLYSCVVSAMILFGSSHLNMNN